MQDIQRTNRLTNVSRAANHLVALVPFLVALCALPRFLLSTVTQGFTPLMYASKLCVSNVDLTRVLLNYGATPGIDEKDLKEGNTPLHWAIVGGVMSPYSLAPLLKVRTGDHRVYCGS